MNSAVRAKVTVLQLAEPGLPLWGYRVVPGNPATGTIAFEEAPEHAG